jgi:hypothetical protein
MQRRLDRPAARQTNLVVKSLTDEVLVYDLERHRAHRLNAAAAAVWHLCDGTRTAPEITAAARDLGTPVTAETVDYALAELGRARLLTAPVKSAALTRRELVQRLGTAAVLPLVASLVAPTAAQAQSCLPNGALCSPSGGVACCECCSGTVCEPCASDRALKTDFAPVDPEEILARVVALPIERWSYRGETVQHLGPMAQDFAVFGLGADDRHISTLDASGVALSAVQGLFALVSAQAARLAALEGECVGLRAELERRQADPAGSGR